MKKSTFAKTALATAALIGAFAAHAQASLYGNMDIGVTRSAGQTTVENGVRSDSYIGLKAGEDLGGGMSVAVKAEGSLATNQGGTFSFDRETSIGLKAGGLLVKAGQLETLASKHAKAFDPLAERGVTAALTNTYGVYKPNSVAAQYSVGALSGEAQYNYDNVTQKADYALGGTYKMGATTLGYAYTKTDAAGSSQQFNAAHDFGQFSAFGTYEDNKDRTTDSAYAVGVKVPMGQIAAIASYGEAELSAGGTAKVTTVALDYSLSKRTSAYTAFKNSKVSGNSTDTFAVGIKHAF